MRAALACLLGAAGSAPGREIPVYREYTVPISFAAAPGERMAAAAGVPDLTEVRSIREIHARDALLGKETLLGLNFSEGSSAFGKRAPVPGKMAPPAGGDDGRRSKRNDAGQNWLVKSIQLPALGQTPSNAAAPVMALDESESDWGWLVDEVAKSADGDAGPQEEPRAETEEFNPFLRDRAAALEPAGNANALPNISAAQGAAGQDRSLSNPNARVGADPVRPGGSSQSLADFSTPKDYRVSMDAAGGLSQTRELIAEFAGAARPDFTALRESLAGAAAGPADEEEIVSAVPGADLLSGATRPSAGSGGPSFAGGASTRSGSGASWQGGWNAAGVEASVLPRVETPSATALPVAPSAGSPRPGLSSGGYKPAWY